MRKFAQTVEISTTVEGGYFLHPPCTVLGIGCTASLKPLLQYLGQLSLLSSVEW